MANTKISALTALTAANTATDDELVIVDTSVTTTKKQTIAQARISFGPQLGTEQASTSGTSIDFTSIPAGVKRITIMFFGVSTNGTSNWLIQLGDSGGVEVTGYLGTGGGLTATPSVANFTTGFGLQAGGTTVVAHGSIVLTLQDASDFTWIANGCLAQSNAAVLLLTAGSKQLSAELDRVRITTVNGTDAFDAGAINISYE